MVVSIGGLSLVAVIVVVNMLLGLIVFLRNPGNLLNRLFLLMVVGIMLWAASSALSDSTTSYTIARYASFVAFGASFLGFCATYLFSEAFKSGALRPRHYAFLITGLGLSLLYATPLVYSLDTIDTYHNGPLYSVYIVSMIGVLVLIVRNFWFVIRKGDPTQRSHARMMAAGFAGMAVLALITNALIPALVPVTWVTKLGPAFTIIFVASVAYSMVWLRLFDLRWAVARTLAYTLTLAVIAVLYAVLLIGVISHFLHVTYDSWFQQTVYVTMAVVLSSTFQPIKRFFDHLTNRLFYQDAYDPQELLDQLNKVLVSSVDIKTLVTKSSQVIAANLKSSSSAVLITGQKSAFRAFGAGRHLFTEQDIVNLLHVMPKNGYKVIASDFLGRQDETLKSFLEAHSASVIIRLTQNSRNAQDVGYVVLGNKKSGNPYSRQDIRVLETIASQLMIAVQNALHYEEIQLFNVTLQQQIDEATRKLRRTNEKLKALDEAKDDFVSMASHQLRTPLTSIKGYTSMVLEGDAGKINATQRQLLEQTYVSAQRMVYLIADLLNVSRLKTGKFVIEPGPVNMADIVQQEIGQLTKVAAGRKLELTYEKPASFPTLMLDETKTRQVIMNFVDNAIYYTPAGGHIKVELLEKPGSVEFRVSDDGIGVPKSEQPHLFTKFYRAGNARQARPDGTGLGLFMAKKVIVAEGGAIIFETEEGKGSTFGFVFPNTKVVSGS